MAPPAIEREQQRGVDRAGGVLQPPPDGGLRGRGDRLADDVVHDRGEHVRVGGALDVTDLRDGRAQPLVPRGQIGRLFFSVNDVHGHLPAAHAAM